MNALVRVHSLYSDTLLVIFGVAPPDAAVAITSAGSVTPEDGGAEAGDILRSGAAVGSRQPTGHRRL